MKAHLAFIWLEGKTKIIADHGQTQALWGLYSPMDYMGEHLDPILNFLRTSNTWSNDVLSACVSKQSKGI